MLRLQSACYCREKSHIHMRAGAYVSRQKKSYGTLSRKLSSYYTLVMVFSEILNEARQLFINMVIIHFLFE